MRKKESAENKIKREKAKILVVDDDLGIRELLSGILSQEGHIVEVVQDGKEALLKVRKESFDLVLSNLRMPRMNGIQLLEELQKIAPHIRVIVIAGAGDLETVTKMRKLGAYDYIGKPFCLNSILHKVKKALGD
ncbi:response regulator [Candidatus Aerophobetes bacterium]|uniref:Response regulator n=1 Tax=Aerophobetes bacterium TaxID=2030807 RepID=A0A523RUW1_UNCAE|nr:MAG: response regulator [Candidatus Aerophobetes bacterium]